MAKIFAVALDFGTSNSGYAYVRYADGRQAYPEVHTYPGMNSSSAYKAPTALLIEKNFLTRCMESGVVTDGDIRGALNDDDKLIYFGKEALDNWNQKGYAFIDNMKMLLYHYNHDNVVSQTYGGIDCKLDILIEILYRVLKLLALRDINQKERGSYSENDCQWGITTPALWSKEINARVRNIISKVVPDEKSVTYIDEARATLYCALRNKILTNQEDQEIQTSQYLIIDIGGGTTDISFARLEMQNNVPVVNMIYQTYGIPEAGNNIDENFCDLLVKHLISEDVDAGFTFGNKENRLQLLNGYKDRFPVQYAKIMRYWRESIKPNLRATNSLDIPNSLVGHIRNNGIKCINCDYIDFSKESLLNCVKPSINVICSEGKDECLSLKDILEKAKADNIRIDNSYLFGGGSLQTDLKREISDLIHHYTGEDIIQETNAQETLGAVLIGACYCMVADIPTIDIAKEYIYSSLSFQVATSGSIDVAYNILREEYNKFNYNLDREEFNNGVDADKESILTPIACKGKPFVDIEQHFRARSYFIDNFVASPEMKTIASKEYINNHKICNYMFFDGNLLGLIFRRDYTYIIDTKESNYGRLKILLKDSDNDILDTKYINF